MIRHLLKLVWHRKRANALVVAEIFFSFLVIFIVGTGAIALIAGWRRPLGYAWDDVWMVSVGGRGAEMRGAARTIRCARRWPACCARRRPFREVVDAAPVETAAVQRRGLRGRWQINGRSVHLTRDRGQRRFLQGR